MMYLSPPPLESLVVITSNPLYQALPAEVTQHQQATTSLMLSTPTKQEPATPLQSADDDQTASDDAAQRRIDSAVEGDWLIYVHIIETNELRAMDPDGSCDPVCALTVTMGSRKLRKTTRIVKKDRNAIFDEHFRFEFRECKMPDIEMSNIIVSVIDADVSVGGHGVGDLIGIFQCDMLESVYSREHHELYRQYVSIENQYSENEEESGCQGFVKLSITVCGPNEKPRIHNIEKDLERERKALAEGNVSLFTGLGAIKSLRFLTIKIGSIESLIMRANSIYVKAEVGNQEIATNPISTYPNPVTANQVMSRYAIVNQVLHLAIQSPSLINNVRLSIWEKRSSITGTSNDKLIANCQMLKISRIKREPDKYNNVPLSFYGAPVALYSKSKNNSAKKRMNSFNQLASTYRGVIECTFTECEANGRRQKNYVEVVDSPQKAPEINAAFTFHINARVLLASSLPTKVSSTFVVRVSCGRFFAETLEGRCDEYGNIASWFEEGIKAFTVETKDDNCPDVIVSLITANNLPACFLRLKASELLAASMEHPTWINMKEDNAINALSDKVFPGSLLLQIGIRRPSALPSSTNIHFIDYETNKQLERRKFCVKLRLLQGCDLPIADQKTGALDAYIAVTMGGTTLETTVCNDTRNPQWFEELSFQDVELPCDPKLRPEVVLKIWDRDVGFVLESDDFVGRFSLRLDGSDSDLAWHKLYFQEHGDIKRGKVFCSVSVESVGGVQGVRKIEVPGKSRTVEVLALGARQLRPASRISMRKPFVEVKVGGGLSQKTRKSTRPDVLNPNFGDRLVFRDVFFPDDWRLAPFLAVSVSDIGTGTMSLKKHVRSAGGGERGEGGSAEEEEEEILKQERQMQKLSKKGNRLEEATEQEYLRGRVRLTKGFKPRPVFNIVTIYRGKKNENTLGERGTLEKYHSEEAGRFNCFIRIINDDDGSGGNNQRAAKKEVVEKLISSLSKPQRFHVRIYLLDAWALVAKDSNGSSDPFLRARVGNGPWVHTATHYKTLKPEFFERLDLTLKVPGAAQLQIEVMDYDKLGSNDLIGRSTIELDYRLFSPVWQRFGTLKPLEVRQLHAERTTQAQGFLKMWVDIIPLGEEEKLYPLIDITPTPEEEFEARVIIWSVDGIRAGDAFTNQSDLFVKCKIGSSKWQSTDTHFLAKRGKGSFNYRLKFPLTLKDRGRPLTEGGGVLKLQCWDADLFTSSDCLCESSIDISDALSGAWALKDSGHTYQLFGGEGRQLVEAERRRRGRQRDSERRAKEGEGVARKNDAPSERDSLLGRRRQSSSLFGAVPSSAEEREGGGASGSAQKTTPKGRKTKMKKKKKKSKVKPTFLGEMRKHLGLTKPENSQWLDFTSTNRKTGETIKEGRILLSVEVLPKSMTTRRPCGEGREEPNQFPYCPQPDGRVDFRKMVNPIYAIKQLMGDAIGPGCYCTLVIILLLICGVLLGPEIQIFMGVVNALPTTIAHGVMLTVLSSIFLCLCYCYCCVCKKDSHEDEEIIDDDCIV